MTSDEKLDIIIKKVTGMEQEIVGIKESVGELLVFKEKEFPVVRDAVGEIPQLKKAVAEIPKIKEAVAEIPKIKEAVAEIPKIKEAVAEIPKIKESVDKIEKRLSLDEKRFTTDISDLKQSVADLKVMDELILDEVERVHNILDQHVKNTALHMA